MPDLFLVNDIRASVDELRRQAERRINLQAIVAVVEPYVAQAKDRGHSLVDVVTDVASGVVPRVGKPLALVAAPLAAPLAALAELSAPTARPGASQPPSS